MRGPFNLSVLGFCLISGGGVGNICDRVVYGSVTDFLHINLLIFQTGIFNVADVTVMAGTFIVLVGSLIDYPKGKVELDS
jgi:signal peptidase II